jgi:hypothetical protein
VKTHLSRMRVAEAAGLLRHGYALAMANLHVLLDYPLIKLPSREWFEALVEGRPTPG